MDRLVEALEVRTSEIREGLEAAYREREELREREGELTALIERAEASLGRASGRNLTLHEAIATVLREGGNRWMTTRELADAVNERGLYRKKDGSPVESNQIHARAKNYSHLFDKDRQNVRLRDQDSPVRSRRIAFPRSKYDALRDRLASVKGDSVTMSFDTIGDLVGSLPQSAWDHQAWWANEAAGSHVQARSWREAGFRVAGVNQTEGWVRFIRDEGDDGLSGDREPRRPRPEASTDSISTDVPIVEGRRP